MFTAPERPFKVKVALCPEPGELARCAEWAGAGQYRRGVTHFQKLGHKLVSFTFTSFLQGLASSTAEILHHNSVHHLSNFRKNLT